MGLFGKLFEKKVCSICNGDIGLLGNRKLEDGNMCKTCAAKLSPWFSDRRNSTVAEIEELVTLLQQVKIYNPSWLHLASGGQSNIMTITYQDGSVQEVNQFGSTLIIDGQGYRAEYEPNEAISQFANKLFNTGF